jgi:uncharacterized protein YijF (DUF1287 family)
MTRLGAVALAAVLGAVVVLAVGRVGRWAVLKTRLPENAFLEHQRGLLRDTAFDPTPDPAPGELQFLHELALAAGSRAGESTVYDPAYVALDYPGGDVDADRGVCTDLLVRAYRDLGIDLQREVHRDMAEHYEAYPSRELWGARQPDTNIDHRRVPNLMAFFRRQGQVLPASADPTSYSPGDIVAWHLGGGTTHIGIVTLEASPETGNPLMAHHVGGHPTVDDSLLRWEIVGHYRYMGPQDQRS